MNDGAVGGVVVRELRSLGSCVAADGLAAIGSEARRLVAGAGGQPGLVQLTKDLASYVGARPTCVLGVHVPDPVVQILAEQDQRWAEDLAARLQRWAEQDAGWALRWAEEAERGWSGEGLDPRLLPREVPA